MTSFSHRRRTVRWRGAARLASGGASSQSRKFGNHLGCRSRDAERRGRCRRLRLSDTAVTPSDCSIENATVSEYERIAADQRDVGAVQRRDHLRHAIRPRRRRICRAR